MKKLTLLFLIITISLEVLNAQQFKFKRFDIVMGTTLPYKVEEMNENWEYFYSRSYNYDSFGSIGQLITFSSPISKLDVSAGINYSSGHISEQFTNAFSELEDIDPNFNFIYSYHYEEIYISADCYGFSFPLMFTYNIDEDFGIFTLLKYSLYNIDLESDVDNSTGEDGLHNDQEHFLGNFSRLDWKLGVKTGYKRFFFKIAAGMNIGSNLKNKEIKVNTDYIEGRYTKDFYIQPLAGATIEIAYSLVKK